MNFCLNCDNIINTSKNSKCILERYDDEELLQLK